MNFNTDIFEQFDKKWALLTAGTADNFNSMTISWGGLGTIWNKPVATVYVRKSRYTKEFMDTNEFFTVSFYPEEMKNIIGVYGSKSGRDIDKMHYEGLTSKAVGESVSFEEAMVTLLCRKLFVQRLDEANMLGNIADTFYGDGDSHFMYIGEVFEIL
ncbi:MAG: flavin reductase [Lachnospiraceae bacterium]|nr:flavin reductase [Lachnospiraceae bacterium]